MNEWIFTFGCGQPLAGKCVRILGTYAQAREKMCSVFGDKWAFQYSAEEWDKFKHDITKNWNMEEEISLDSLKELEEL